MTRIIDPSDVARQFRSVLRGQVAAIDRPLKVVGFLSSESGPSATYARYTATGCEDVGILFDLRQPGRLAMESAIDAANGEIDVQGIIVYYPVFGTERDNYIKDLVTPAKDIEGMNSYWSRKLYRNERYLDGTHTKKAILPCTPLAIIKLLEAAGVMSGGDAPLAGKTITVFNRSEVVGRPLAAMLANDGAKVYSFDVDGPLLFSRERVQETSAVRADALAESDVIITGVPNREFHLVQAAEISDRAVCINFSTLKNFTDEAQQKAAVFIPRVGPMTVTMALRNTLRLYDNHRAG